VQVTTSTTAPDPGAYQGTKCLRLRRLADGEDFASARAVFVVPATLGEHLRIAAAVYVPAVEQNTAEIAQVSVGGAINLIANFGGYRSVVSFTGDGVSHDTGVGFIAGKWQRWQIDYVVGATRCMLTIDGRSASGIPANAADRAGHVEFWANQVASNPIYVDDVLVLDVGKSMGLRVEVEGTAQQH
jgi:hypothetical protein